MVKKNIIIVAAVILAVVVIFVLIQGLKTDWQFKKLISPQPKTEQEKLSEEKKTETPVDPTTMIRAQLMIQARAFIERYGTYSLDSGFQNLRELLPLMSEKLAAETSMKIAQGLDRQQDFFSFVVKVGSLGITEFIPDVRVVFIAQVQEQEMRPGQTNVLQKTVELTFVKQGEEWRVDEIKIR